MQYEDVTRISEQIVVRQFKDKEGCSLETNIWYHELKDIIARQVNREQTYKETIGLLNSMVLSGENHSEQSRAMVDRALKMVPTNEEIWQKATKLAVKDLIEKTTLGETTPSDGQIMLDGLPIYYYKRAIAEIERGR